MTKRSLPLLPGAILLGLASVPLIAQVSVPHVFQAGETAVADEVNANFQELQDQLNDALQRIEELEADSVAGLGEHVEVIADPNHPNDHVVRFTGVNVQIVNGLEETESVNGMGNLIVGYNEPLDDTVCSQSEGESFAFCNEEFPLPEPDRRAGSHNIVVGTQHSYSSIGGLVAGAQNTISGLFATVSGGQANLAAGGASSVSGGLGNIADGGSSSVSGGLQNMASGFRSTVSGGFNNQATGSNSSVTGGHLNEASGTISSVSGGRQNVASGSRSSILGGYSNEASGGRSAIVGGYSNDSSRGEATVLGGRHNNASGPYSAVIGGRDNSATEFDDIAPAID